MSSASKVLECRKNDRPESPPTEDDYELRATCDTVAISFVTLSGNLEYLRNKLEDSKLRLNQIHRLMDHKYLKYDKTPYGRKTYANDGARPIQPAYNKWNRDSPLSPGEEHPVESSLRFRVADALFGHNRLQMSLERVNFDLDLTKQQRSYFELKERLEELFGTQCAAFVWTLGEESEEEDAMGLVLDNEQQSDGEQKNGDEDSTDDDDDDDDENMNDNENDDTDDDDEDVAMDDSDIDSDDDSADEEMDDKDSDDEEHAGNDAENDAENDADDEDMEDDKEDDGDDTEEPLCAPFRITCLTSECRAFVETHLARNTMIVARDDIRREKVDKLDEKLQELCKILFGNSDPEKDFFVEICDQSGGPPE